MDPWLFGSECAGSSPGGKSRRGVPPLSRAQRGGHEWSEMQKGCVVTSSGAFRVVPFGADANAELRPLCRNDFALLQPSKKSLQVHMGELIYVHLDHPNHPNVKPAAISADFCSPLQCRDASSNGSVLKQNHLSFQGFTI